MRIPPRLAVLIRRNAAQPVPRAVHALADAVRERYGDSVQAVLFYGSCFRAGTVEGLVDLYVLVDAYRSGYRNIGLAVLNRLLPPNVFYLEIPFGEGVVRSKVAVLSLKDFRRGTSRRWFHSYLWGRFSQPAGLLYSRSEEVAEQVVSAMAQAVMTFVSRVTPRLASRFDARDLWREGLLLCYRAELRTERPDGVIRLFDAARGEYESLTRAAMAGAPFPVDVDAGAEPARYHARIPSGVRRVARFAWGARILQGKMLSVLRLLKGMCTFHGGLDYILWKIERHSGVTVEVTPRMRRHPFLGIWVLSWRLYRRGAFR